MNMNPNQMIPYASNQMNMMNPGRDAAVNPAALESIVSWGGLVGIYCIIVGALCAVIGLFPIIITAIPGVIIIILGTKILGIRNEARYLMTQPAGPESNAHLNVMISHMASYIHIQGIFCLIALILLISSVLISLFFGAAIIASFS